jgi:hypothetical protein
MRVLQVILSCVGLLFCFACRSSLDVREYVHYVESPDNGLRIEKEAGHLKFISQYKPVEYLALQNDPAHNPANVSKETEELQGFHYFTFRITSKNGTPVLESKENTEEHFQKLNYAEFSLQRDFSLVEGNDTLPCEIYHFERSYNLSPFSNFILAFPAKNKTGKNDLTLVYNDNLFGTGKSQFTIKAKDLKGIPGIKNL